ncbi:MAG: VanZ family protein [Pseudomonadota bacterium]|nr:VanZ family protein [Pseudomonadota bacterium]
MIKGARYYSFLRFIGLLFLIGVLAISLWPFSEQSEMLVFNDKLIHFVTFAFLMIWFTGVFKRTSYLKIFLFLFLYGLSIEIIQSFTTYRFMSLGDLLADLVGLCLGYAAVLFGFDRWPQWLKVKIP